MQAFSPSRDDWTRIEMQRSGGQMPTLRPHFQLDLAQMPPADRTALRNLLSKSNFVGLPARFPGAPHPDAYTYRITAWNGEGAHTVEFSDDDGHPETLDALLQWMLLRKP